MVRLVYKLDQPADLDPLIEEIGDKKYVLLGEASHGRTIGVVYNPAYERYGNYVDNVLPSRYDAFMHIDETRALHPLHMSVSSDEDSPEKFPSGLVTYLTPVGPLFSSCSSFMCSSLS